MKWAQTKIADSDLSKRAKHILRSDARLIAGDVASMSLKRIAMLPGVGQLTRREIIGWLVELQHMPDSIPYPPKGLKK